MATTPSHLFALTAGLVSFFAPCVVPLVPGFLSYLAHTTLKDANHRRRVIFLTTLSFVIGFSVIFALLGVLLNTLLERVAYDAQLWLSRLGGVIIILFGLYLIGIIKPAFLNRDYRFHLTHHFASQYLTAAFFGAAFAFGWTPCVGAVLGSILALAATQPGSAFSLLMTYALGLSVPFLLIGLFTAESTRLITRLNPFFARLNRAFGLFLLLMGMLMLTQSLYLLSSFHVMQSWLF